MEHDRLVRASLHPRFPCLQGAGLLLSESVISVSHGLHSRAPRLLATLLEEDLVKTEDLATKQVRGLCCAQHCTCVQGIKPHNPTWAPRNMVADKQF